MDKTLRPEVQDAVNDILNGVSRDSAIEWLQREYIRLMKREANWRSSQKRSHPDTRESNFKKNPKTSNVKSDGSNPE